MDHRARRYTRFTLPFAVAATVINLVVAVVANVVSNRYLLVVLLLAVLAVTTLAMLGLMLPRRPAPVSDPPPLVGANPYPVAPGPEPGPPHWQGAPVGDPPVDPVDPPDETATRVLPTWIGPQMRRPRARQTGGRIELPYPTDPLPVDEWVDGFARRVRTTLLVGPDDQSRVNVLDALAAELGAVPEPRTGRYDPERDTPDRKVLWLDLSLWDQLTRGWLFERARADHSVDEDWLRHWLDDGSVALIIDGLDEIEPPLRDECASMVENLIADFAAAVVVLACQQSVYSSRRWTGFDQLATVFPPVPFGPIGAPPQGTPIYGAPRPAPPSQGYGQPAPRPVSSPPPPWVREDEDTVPADTGAAPPRRGDEPEPADRPDLYETAPLPRIRTEPEPTGPPMSQWSAPWGLPLFGSTGWPVLGSGGYRPLRGDLPEEQRRIVAAMSEGRGYDFTQLASAARVVPSALTDALDALTRAGLVTVDHDYGETRYRLADQRNPR